MKRALLLCIAAFLIIGQFSDNPWVQLACGSGGLILLALWWRMDKSARATTSNITAADGKDK